MATTKKRASKKKAVAKAPGTAVANIDEELSREAALLKERIGAPETKNISIRDKIFTFPDQSVKEAPLEVVIFDFMAWNTLYEHAYDPKNPQPPGCWAYGYNLKELAPSSNAPSRQADACDGCWANEFGSGTGDSKACKNTRRLVVMRANDDPAEGELFTLSVPPASLKSFDGYISSVARVFGGAPLKVITKIHFHPEAQHAKLLFGNPEPNEAYREHYQRRAEARELLEAEPDVTGYEPPAGKGAKKKATRRRA